MIDSLEIAKYRWEFIRRNDEYRKDWKSFFKNPDIKTAKKLLKKWEFFNFPQSSDLNKTWDNIGRPKGDMYSYEQRESAIWPQIKDLIVQEVFRYSSTRPSYYMEPDLMGDITGNGNTIECNDGTNPEKFYIISGGQHADLKSTDIPDEITIVICRFRKYLSADDVVKHAFRGRVLDFIDQKFKLWESAAKKFKLSPTKQYRHRLNYYDDHLKVWDLVNQHGMKWKTIVKIISPDSKSIESDINRVKASYQQACELIKNAKDIFAEK
jgi:hypothetical protein